MRDVSTAFRRACATVAVDLPQEPGRILVYRHLWIDPIAVGTEYKSGALSTGVYGPVADATTQARCADTFRAWKAACRNH